MFQLILIVIHEALTLLFLPVSCHYTRPRSARTHLAALAGAKNVALDADLPCVFLGGGRVVQVQNCSVVVRTLVTNELDERTSVTGIVWWSNTRYKRLFGRWLQTYFGKGTLVTNVHGCWNVVYRRLFPPKICYSRRLKDLLYVYTSGNIVPGIRVPVEYKKSGIL